MTTMVRPKSATPGAVIAEGGATAARRIHHAHRGQAKTTRTNALDRPGYR